MFASSAERLRTVKTVCCQLNINVVKLYSCLKFITFPELIMLFGHRDPDPGVNKKLVKRPKLVPAGPV